MPSLGTLLILIGWSSAVAQTLPPAPVELGGVSLRPGGFFEVIGMSRSATTGDNVSTHFGAIPLAATPAETIVSPRHSRLYLRADNRERPVQLTAYLESDFLNPNAAQTPFRWRQAWGAARWGKWQLLAGKAWSLLRPNRTGVESDSGLMNTIVVDPAYHTGIVGSRNRQFRLARSMGDYHAVFAWETAGRFLAKATMDKRFGHVELAAFAGHRAERGASAAATWNVKGPVRFVTQQYWSKGGADQALGLAPPHVSGGSALEGVEIAVTRHIDLYSYAGWVYAARSSGNRVVRQYTAGADYHIPAPVRGTLLFSLQLSRLDRALWSPQAGTMTFAMCRFRYTFN